jgi:ABC-type multidrug transport system ATPase subunit
VPATTADREAAQSRAGEAPAPAIELAGLVREYDEVPVLDRVDLTLERGTTLAVLGPNGAGKTTLLRILATLLRPTAGTVRVLGHELPRHRWTVRGHVGLLGHEPMLYRELTVVENLTLQARLHGIADPARRIAELLEAAGMTPRAGQRVRELSAGMVQRAAACRAVLHDPELLLLDEPTSHLDPEAAERVSALLAGRGERTTVLVSHNVGAALAATDQTLLLRAGGSVAFSGPSSGLSEGDARAAYGGAA